MSSPGADGDRVQQESLRSLDDERSVLQVLYTFNAMVDEKKVAESLACFTEDAVQELRTAWDDTPIFRHAGKEEIRTHLEKALAVEITKHVIASPIVAVRGDEASIVAYAIRLAADTHRRPFLKSFATVKCELVRIEGRWRMRSHVTIRETEAATPPA